MDKDTKVFVIINSYFIGDVLLTDSLIQNIKRLYPNSEVVSLVSPALVDIAKYLEGVDNVIVWDRKGKDRGFWGMLKFVLRFPYKNIYACFPIYGMDRPVMLSLLLRAKYILCPKQKFFSKFRKTKYKLALTYNSCQKTITELLSGITQEKLQNTQIKYNVPDIQSDIIDKLPNNYTVVCFTSTRKTKEIPINISCEIIEKLNDKHLVLLGKGQTINEYSNIFKNKNYNNLIDLSNKTTLLESAKIIEKAHGMITVDTGLMHLACAVNTPFVSVFYEKDTKEYIPDKNLYICDNITDNQTSQNIVETYNKLLGE